MEKVGSAMITLKCDLARTWLGKQIFTWLMSVYRSNLKGFRLSNSQIERSFVVVRGCYLQGLWFGTLNPSVKAGWGTQRIEVILGCDLARSLAIEAGVRSRHITSVLASFTTQVNTILSPTSFYLWASVPHPSKHSFRRLVISIFKPFKIYHALIHLPLLLSKYDTKEYFHDVCNFQIFSRIREDFAEYDGNVISLPCGAGCDIDTMLGQTIRLIRWTMTHWSMWWLYQFVVGCDTHVE